MDEESKKQTTEDVTVRPKKKKYRDPRPTVDKHAHGAMNAVDRVPKPIPKPVPEVRYEDTLEYSKPPSSESTMKNMNSKTRCAVCNEVRSNLSAVCFKCGHVRYGRLIATLVLSTLLVCGVSQVYSVVYWKFVGKPLAVAEVKSTFPMGLFQSKSNAQKAKEKKDLDEAFEKGLETLRSIK